MPEDARGRLVEEPFDHRVTNDGGVLVFRGGRRVSVMSGATAAQLAGRLVSTDERGRQLLLAGATGNYRRGNEGRRGS